MHKLPDIDVCNSSTNISVYGTKNTALFKCFYTNIRSLNKNFDILEANVSMNEYDMLIFTECWLNSESLVPVLSGFDTFHVAACQAGGICIYIKKTSKLCKLVSVI